MSSGIYLEIDASDLSKEIERLQGVLKPERFDRVMYGVFARTGQHVRGVLKKDLPKEYRVKAGEVGVAVKGARVTSGGTSGVGCVIPVVGPRRTIGGDYKATGGAHGWISLRKKYRVKARIVVSAQSMLPVKMETYGGEAPFRNLGSKLGKIAYTRLGKERLPIVRVEGVAIPQMPMNRSEEDVQKDILAYMEKRIEHEIQRAIGG